MKKKSSLAMLSALALANGVNPFYRKSVDPLEGIDIAKEYALIQLKKSNLSASKRGLVVDRYREQMSKA